MAVVVDGADLAAVEVLQHHALEQVVDVLDREGEVDAGVALDGALALEVADAAGEQHHLRDRQLRPARRHRRLDAGTDAAGWAGDGEGFQIKAAAVKAAVAATDAVRMVRRMIPSLSTGEWMVEAAQTVSHLSDEPGGHWIGGMGAPALASYLPVRGPFQRIMRKRGDGEEATAWRLLAASGSRDLESKATLRRRVALTSTRIQGHWDVIPSPNHPPGVCVLVQAGGSG